MTERPVIALAAGGTGGHLFPAEALARELARRGHPVELLSDARVAPHADRFPARAIHRLTAGTVTGAGLLGKVRGALALARGLLEAGLILRRLRPAAVVGFGGYPSVPPVLAASLMGIPTVLHEQNAVMGRANRFLAPRVRRIASGFRIGGAAVLVGNPVRDAVLAAAERPFPPLDAEGPLRVLVVGGSQGARIMGDVVPEAVALLDARERAALSLTQQVRAEDRDRVEARYRDLGVEATLAAFFHDLPERLAASHLVIARAGASTVAELMIVGRPSILVPLPGALDQDQAANARVLAEAGAAEVIPQPMFTPAALAARLRAALADPLALRARAEAAKALGAPRAASDLADLVLSTCGAG